MAAQDSGMVLDRRLLLAGLIWTPALRAQERPPPLIPPARLDDSLEIEGETLEARRQRARLFVDVQVNGQGPFRFLVDSGADRSVIGSALAQRLGLAPAGMARVQSMAGATDVETVRLETLAVGPSVSTGMRLPALGETFIGADGLLGIDALAESRILLDYEKRQVTVQDSRSQPARGPDEIVVTARRRKGQLILTEVRVSDQRLYAVIDSGSEMTVGTLALARRLFGRRKLAEMRQIGLVAVTGETLLADLAIMPELKVGSFSIRNLAVAFVDAAPFQLFGLADQPALLLGADALQSFRRVALDFGNRRVRFTLRR
jgi:predicted aspartyl protease